MMKSPEWRAAFYLIASVLPKSLIWIYIWKNLRNRYVLFVPIFLRKRLPDLHPILLRKENSGGEKHVCFPNAFPYDQNNNVAIFSSRHFVPMNELTPEMMRDGFGVCHDYFHRVVEMNLGCKYCSINWNYMPPSGGGLIHPHLQTIAGYKPTS